MSARRHRPGPLMISVILPVLDAWPWVEEQLRALAAQKCEEPWEVVVADNGSTDGSLEFARTWCGGHEGFRLVDASESPGAPATRNAGVRDSTGDLLAFCDADDVVHAGWLQAMVDALQDADVVAGAFDFWSLNRIPPTPAIPAANRQLGFLPAGLGANLAIRRVAFEEVGGFNDDLFVGEDIDLCWQTQLRGHRFSYAWDAIVSKRERYGSRDVFRQAFAYGRCGPMLFRRYRNHGARRDLLGAAKSWLWLLLSCWMVFSRERRYDLARTAGMRLGRIAGSMEQQVLFP